MSTITKQLSVRLHGQPIGILEQIDGKMSFSYLPDVDLASTKLSYSMPEEGKYYTHDICEAYFGGLLPEGEVARKAIARQFGVNAHNVFSLLSVIGYDCAGAVAVVSMDVPIVPDTSVSIEGRMITEQELVKHIQELPKKPLFINVDGLRLSLAGVQDKAAVCVIEKQIAIPQHNSMTTHILKPAINQYADSVLNEYFCLSLAKRIGLNAPHVEMRIAGDISYLLIERYDRKILSNGKLMRIHQEDFCQALGIATVNKYQSEGGPGFKDSFSLVNRTQQPAVARVDLVKRALFNYFIGNNDAHGKNFSLLYNTAKGTLSPLYDVLSTTIYPDLTRKMAMKIGNQKDSDRVFSRHWEQLCTEIDFSYPTFKKMIPEMCNAIVTAAEVELQQLESFNKENTCAARIVEQLKRRIDKM